MIVKQEKIERIQNTMQIDPELFTPWETNFIDDILGECVVLDFNEIKLSEKQVKYFLDISRKAERRC